MEETHQAERSRGCLNADDTEEQRYQRERAAYRAERASGGPATPAALPRLSSLSNKARKQPVKSALPPAPSPEEASSSSDPLRSRSFHAVSSETPGAITPEALVDEKGTTIPLSPRSTLPPPPRDCLVHAHNALPAAASVLPPGLSVGAAVHEPSPSGARAATSRSSEQEAQIALRRPPGADEVSTPMSSPRLALMGRMSGEL